MAEARIPVDLFNPGQVFACLGLLEAADALLGEAAGCFDWSDEDQPCFCLEANGEDNPVQTVLEFLACSEVRAFAPIGFDPAKGGSANAEGEGEDEDQDEDDAPEDEAAKPDHAAESPSGPEMVDVFPASKGEGTALPVMLGATSGPKVELSHWCDGSGVETFKLYSGNRSAERIARAMLKGTREKPLKGQSLGAFKTKGIAALWNEKREALVERPFHVLTPMGGSFNFDPRGGWTAIDAGYSPNTQKHQVAASPVVELLAAWGLQHSRPVTWPVRQVRYAVWNAPLGPELARFALQGALPFLTSSECSRSYHFELAMSGKNKVVTFAQQETHA